MEYKHDSSTHPRDNFHFQKLLIEKETFSFGQLPMSICITLCTLKTHSNFFLFVSCFIIFRLQKSFPGYRYMVLFSLHSKRD